MPYRSLIMEALYTLNSPPVVSFKFRGLGLGAWFLSPSSSLLSCRLCDRSAPMI